MSTYTPVTACCGETEPTNPKRDLFRQHRQTGLQLYNISNPIPDEISDGADLRGFFKKWRLIPFAGTTDDSGQSLLLWYLMLAQLSPTHSACISKKVKYAVGGKGTFVQSVDPQWDTGEDDQPLPPAQKVACREMFNKYIRFEDGVTSFHRRLARSYEATGNAWVEMIYADTLGEKVVTMKAHRVTHCLYQETKAGQERVVVISPVWTDDYLKNNEPRYLNTYPKFTKYPDGTLRTIFHLKNGENSWYGRPETSGADI